MTRKIISTRRLKSGTCNTFEFELAKCGEFHRFCPFKSLEVNCEDPRRADLIICSLTGAKEFLADNKGTPVIIVDSYPDPSISQDLVDIVRRPEVKVCLRKWGFRDPASYYRGSSYYDSVADLASSGMVPDPFPVFTDEPVGNVVRKIRTLLPPSQLLQSTYDVPSWEDRDLEWVGQVEARSVFERSKVVISTRHFPSTDFLALASGCVLIKPESSNVRGYCDIYSAQNRHVLHCSHTFDKLGDYVQEALCRPPSQEDVKSYQEMQLASKWEGEFNRLCMDILHGKERLGDITKVTPLI